jgi:hypothetical protein
MKWRVLALVLCLCGSRISKAQVQPIVLPDAPRPQPGIIVGTVIDVNNDPVPRAQRRSSRRCPQKSSHGRGERQRFL